MHVKIPYIIRIYIFKKKIFGYTCNRIKLKKNIIFCEINA